MVDIYLSFNLDLKSDLESFELKAFKLLIFTNSFFTF